MDPQATNITPRRPQAEGRNDTPAWTSPYNGAREVPDQAPLSPGATQISGRRFRLGDSQGRLRIPRPPTKQLSVTTPRNRVALTLLLIVVLIAAAAFSFIYALRASKDTRALHPTPTGTTGISTAGPTLTPAATIPPGTIPALSVRGTQIYDAAGKQVMLTGASRFSLDYSCQGDGHFELADFRAMRSWGMNVVRLPLWSREWLNLANDCPNYQQTVTKAIANAEAAGLYVIVDLQWNAPFNAEWGLGLWQYPMPDANTDAKFWTDIATRYKADPSVLFDLLGEPHDVSWSVWLNGGAVSTVHGTYQAIGMKPLVAKIRAIAPNNLIIISGLNWGYDLSMISKGFAIAGSNILYGTHPFEHGDKLPGTWPTSFGDTANSYPVIATEFGQYDCGTGYNSQAIAYFEQLHISWLAWEWGVSNVANPCDPKLAQGPFLLADWFGTPSSYGQFIKQQMLKVNQAG